MEKSEIRKQALEKRNALTAQVRRSKSEVIRKQLESFALFKESETVLLYLSHNSEVETLELIRIWMPIKNIMLPRLMGDESFIALSIASTETLETNRYGIKEPRNSNEARRKPDLIIVPGVAFDRKGNRIGMGKGYYDRFLADNIGVPRVALAYSEQILERVPKEPYDETVDWIVTEDELIRCKFSL